MLMVLPAPAETFRAPAETLKSDPIIAVALESTTVPVLNSIVAVPPEMCRPTTYAPFWIAVFLPCTAMSYALTLLPRITNSTLPVLRMRLSVMSSRATPVAARGSQM